MMVVSSWLKALGIITGYYVLSDLAHQKMKECNYSSNHILLPKVSQYYVRHLGKLLNVTQSRVSQINKCALKKLKTFLLSEYKETGSVI